jgi:peptidoglycan/LPS O-acetylase OafA/YrhL
LILSAAYLTPAFAFSHAQFPAYRFVLYIQNCWSLDHAPTILGTTWSLAIEEQFYVVWPLLIWVIHSPRRVSWAAITLIAVAPLSRVLLDPSGVDPYSMTVGPSTVQPWEQDWLSLLLHTTLLRSSAHNPSFKPRARNRIASVDAFRALAEGV